MSETELKIQLCLLEAMRRISEQGIAKMLKADLGGAKVNYRGIEQAMNKMSPILIGAGITVTPAYSDLVVTERQKAEVGKATRFATLKGSFTFAASDGSSVVSECYGEAMDSGDKAVTKAQSVAFRTALFQQFIVPTEATAIDPERDGDGDDAGDDDQELAAWRAVAMQGSKALRAHYEANVPTDAFWTKHQRELKAAAKSADEAAK